MKLNIIVAFESGIPADDPIVTASAIEAKERFEGLCDYYGLDPEDPHDERRDVWWWEVDLKA